MLNLLEFGADAKKPAAASAKPVPKAANPAAVREAFATDLAKAMVACQKLGIDIRNPALCRSLMVTGGSAAALAAHVGPEKTMACLKMFAGLGQHYKAYIFSLEKSYNELASFMRLLKRKTGKTPTKKAKKEAKMAADMGAMGTLLALGAAGAAIYFVVRQFASKDVADKVSEPRPPVVITTPIKLKDAADKKYLDAEMSMAEDGTKAYSGTYKGKPFQIDCKPGYTPVWSGLRWMCMPDKDVAAIAMAGIQGLGAGNLQSKECEGVDTCCNGSLEEIVGDMGYSFIGAKKQSRVRRRRQLSPEQRKKLAQMTPAQRKQLAQIRRMEKRMPGMARIAKAADRDRSPIPGEVPAGTIKPVRPIQQRYGQITRMKFEPMVITPGAVSPMNETLDPQTRMVLDMITDSMPANQRYSGLVVNRRLPTTWPGSRGSYKY